MKLIDLLVQELPNRGGWPAGIGKISMHADGMTYRDGSRWPGGLYGLRCSDGWHHQLPSVYTNAVTREQYEAALAASKQPVWNGEGLPPVGCECEREAPRGWSRCRINYVSNALIVYQMLETGNEYASTLSAFKFRPSAPKKSASVMTQ